MTDSDDPLGGQHRRRSDTIAGNGHAPAVSIESAGNRGASRRQSDGHMRALPVHPARMAILICGSLVAMAGIASGMWAALPVTTGGLGIAIAGMAIPAPVIQRYTGQARGLGQLFAKPLSQGIRLLRSLAH